MSTLNNSHNILKVHAEVFLFHSSTNQMLKTVGFHSTIKKVILIVSNLFYEQMQTHFTPIDSFSTMLNPW